MPVWLHEKLKLMAIKKQKTFSEVVLEAFLNERWARSLDKMERQVEEDLKFFAKVRSSGPQIDAAEIIRKERDLH